MTDAPYQNKIDDFATSLILVYRKIPVYWKLRYVGIAEKVIHRHTDIGFITSIFGISVYPTALIPNTHLSFYQDELL